MYDELSPQATSENMTAPTTSLPATRGQLKALLRRLDLPELSQEAINAIGEREADEFKRSLVVLADRTEGWQRKQDYIDAVFVACAPVTRAVVRHLGLEASIDQLLEISKTEGRAFRHAIRGMQDDSISDERQTMRDYLLRVLRQSGCPSADLSENGGHQLPQGSVHDPASLNVDSDMPNRQGVVHPFPSRSMPSVSQRELENNNEAVQEIDGSRDFESYHVYGNSAGICFSAGTTRGKKQQPTVWVEAAAKVNDKYNWNAKVSLQLSLSELPLVFGIFYGYIDAVTLEGHGKDNEKTFGIEKQGNKFFVRLRVRGMSPIAIPIIAQDTFSLMALLLKQIRRTHDLPADLLLLLIESVCRTYSTPQLPRSSANA